MNDWRDFRKVPVGQDRYVLVTTVRIFATDMFAVALVDSTGRLIEPGSLKVTPNQSKARTAANMLVVKNGGEHPPIYEPPTKDRGSTAPTNLKWRRS